MGMVVKYYYYSFNYGQEIMYVLNISDLICVLKFFLVEVYVVLYSKEIIFQIDLYLVMNIYFIYFWYYV